VDNEQEKIEARRAARRALGACIGVLVAALVATRLGIELIASDRPWAKQRVVASVEAFPSIAADRSAKLALVMGSSRVMNDFVPEVFDARLAAKGKTVRSYNLGTAHLTTPLQVVLAQHFCADLQRVGRKADLTVVDFAIDWNTVPRTQQPFIAAATNMVECMTGSATSFASKGVLTPIATASLIYERYILHCFPAEEVTSSISRLLDRATAKDPSWWFGSPKLIDPETLRDDEIAEKLHDARELSDAPKVYEWTIRNRGYQSMAEPVRRIYIDDFLPYNTSDVQLSRQLEKEKRVSDIIELHFDDGLVRAFIDLVNELKGCSKDIVVWVLPSHPKWIVHPPEAAARFADVLARITRETGVEIIDDSASSDFGPAEFEDLSHLNRSTGARKMSALFADQVTDRL
jgi:hypothetical protein